MIKEGHMCIHTHRNIFFFYMTRKKIEEYAMPGELKAMKMVWFYIFLNWSISQFSHSVVSNSLGLHGLQHARLPCPSPTPGDYSKSCPSCRWCHPTISSSVIPFSFCLQSFTASGSFPMSQFFAPGGQSIEVSASASVLAMNIQDWFSLGWTGWISLQSKGLSRVFLTPQFKSINSLTLSFVYSPTLTFIHDYWKNYNFD